jgi:hypothetical protein
LRISCVRLRATHIGNLLHDHSVTMTWVAVPVAEITFM